MKKLLSIIAVGLAFACTSRAQTTINSDGVSVRNSAPGNVFFMFPVGDSNITEIQFGCSDSLNHNYVFVYEEQPNGFIKTYSIQVQVDCNEFYSPDDDADDTTFIGSLKHDITVTTADHMITIKASTAWTAFYGFKSGWKATSGSSQIVVQ